MYLVRHAPVKANDPGAQQIRGWQDLPVEPTGHQVAKQRAEVFMDTPLKMIHYSPVERSEVMAKAIQNYTGAIMRPNFALMSWNMGDYQGQKNTAEIKKQLDAYMMESPRSVIPGGESYLMFLTRLLPQISFLSRDQECAAVTHFRDFCAIAAWDAAGRNGITVDLGVLKNSGEYDNILVAEVTPDSFMPLVMGEEATSTGS